MANNPKPGGSTKKNGNQNISVSLRCRPLNSMERKAGSAAVVDANSQSRTVTIRERLSHLTKTYNFDHVFPPHSTQIDVYKAVVEPVIDEVLQGYNCTVFAYGQTGTGKTFTMEGERTEGLGDMSWEKDPLSGIIPRAMKHIFDLLISTDSEFSVRVSYVELYNEDIFDLLCDSSDPLRLKIYDDSSRKGSTVIQGMEEVQVHNKDEIYAILEKGSTKRKTEATLLNDRSSRSHSVFTVTVHTKEVGLDGCELVKMGKLNLVDLAGSENIARSGAMNQRAREAGNINQSLLTLGRVITSLVEHTPHIPYRESKLTRLLQDSLGGKTKTSIIATISPAACNYEETMSTLDYAFRAKNVQNKPEINQKVNKKTLLKDYTEEMRRLRADLMATREKNGIFISQENYDSQQNRLSMQAGLIKEHEEKIQYLTVMNRLSMQAGLIKEHEEKIQYLTEEKDKICALFTTTKGDLDQATEDLSMTQSLLDVTKTELEEQQFLVTEHVKAEAKLTTDAQMILDSATTTEKDVNLMHDKVDRKIAVDVDNAQIQSQYVTKYTGLVSEIRGSLKTNCEGHMERLGQSKQELGKIYIDQHDIISKNDEMIREVMKGIESFGEKVEEDKLKCVAASEGVDDQIAALTTQRDSVLKLCAANNAFVLQKMSEMADHTRHITQLNRECMAAHEDHVAGLINKMKSDTTESVKILDGVSTDLTAYIEERTTKDAQFLKDVAQFEEAQREFDAKQQELEAEQTAMVEELAVRQRELMDACLAKQTTMGQKLRDLTGNKTETRHNFVVNTKQHKEVATADIERVSSSKSTIQPMGPKLESETAYVSDQLLTDSQRLADHTKQCEEILATTDCVTVAVSQESTKFTTESKEMATKINQDVTAILESHRIRHREGEAMNIDTVAYLLTLTQSNQAQLDENSENTANVKSVVTTQQDCLEQQIQAHSTDCVGMDERMGEVHDGWMTQASDMRHDIPTGLTPQRKDYTFPRSIPKRLHHATLLENFARSKEATLQEEGESKEVESQDEGGQEEPNAECIDIPDDVSDAGSSVSMTTSGISSIADVCKENLGRRKRIGSKKGTPGPKSRLPLLNRNK